MLSYEQALERLCAAADPVARVEVVSSHLALGRVLAADILSAINVPPADNSAMDGYAVRVAELGAGQALTISQRIPAGTPPAPLQPGTVARIFTGAQIPAGADAVVVQEKTTVDGDLVQFQQHPKPGDNIRRTGEDIAFGSTVLTKGIRLGAAHLGLLASVGVAQVKVYARLRVAVFFTGDELVMPGEPLRPGAIYNSNRHVLHGLLGGLGCAVSDLGIVADDLEATRQALRQAAEGHDLVLTCGGVSAGEEDHVKAAVLAEGALDTWKIEIKPGKPFAFGRVGSTPFIGLPGNPVSGFVTFLMLAQAHVLKRQGVCDYLPRALTLRADFSWPHPARVREFLRVRRNAEGGLDLYPKQGSGVLSSCAWADGLVDNPPDQVIQPGNMVRYISLS